MTLEQLHNLLSELLEEGVDPNTEVRIAEQPNYPLQSHILGVATPKDINEFYKEEGKEREEEESCIWIVSGNQVYDSPYPPRVCWDVVRDS